MKLRGQVESHGHRQSKAGMPTKVVTAAALACCIHNSSALEDIYVYGKRIPSGTDTSQLLAEARLAASQALMLQMDIPMPDVSNEKSVSDPMCGRLVALEEAECIEAARVRYLDNVRICNAKDKDGLIPDVDASAIPGILSFSWDATDAVLSCVRLIEAQKGVDEARCSTRKHQQMVTVCDASTPTSGLF